MKEFDTDYIEKLIDIMKNNELTEVTLEDENRGLVIKTNGLAQTIKKKDGIQETVTVVEEVVPQQEERVEEPQVQIKKVPIVSSMIGLFFSKPSPEEEPFVKVGDEIKEGQVICIIETIKLMNKITSDVSGKIVEICIDDGKPVEYGQVIMYVEQE